MKSMRDIKAEGTKYDELLKYVAFFFLNHSDFNDIGQTEKTKLSAFRRHSGDSAQGDASLDEKIKKVCNVSKKSVKSRRH